MRIPPAPDLAGRCQASRTDPARESLPAIGLLSSRLKTRRRGVRIHAALLGLVTLSFSACGPRLIKPLDPGPPSAAAAVPDWSDWGVILNRAVKPQGVDYRLDADGAARMDRTLAMLARTGPTRTPQYFGRRQDALAYAINAFNACIFESVRRILLNSHASTWQVAGLEGDYAFVIDGRPRTPAQLREWATELAGSDWRVRFALCDGRVVGPPLWPRPLLGDMLDGQLNQVVHAAIASDSVVAVDHGERKLLELWSGLYEIRGRLIAEYERKTGASGASILNPLLEWADADRRFVLNSAIGYHVVEMPGTLQLNVWTPVPDRGVLNRLTDLQFVRPNE